MHRCLLYQDSVGWLLTYLPSGLLLLSPDARLSECGKSSLQKSQVCSLEDTRVDPLGDGLRYVLSISVTPMCAIGYSTEELHDVRSLSIRHRNSHHRGTYTSGCYAHSLHRTSSETCQGLRRDNGGVGFWRKNQVVALLLLYGTIRLKL